jgi:TorA maturation chaperone TorD
MEDTVSWVGYPWIHHITGVPPTIALTLASPASRYLKRSSPGSLCWLTAAPATPEETPMHDAQSLKLHGFLLRKPDQDLLDRLQTLSEEHRWMQAGLHELTLTPLEAWQGEYTRLFVEGDPKTPAPPYESVYRQQERETQVLQRLQALYREAGLNIGEKPADYLGTQLAFAAQLAASDDPRASRWLVRLWRDHLQQWLPRFVADVCEHSQLLIYRLWGGQLTLLSKQMQELTAYA